MDTNKNTDKSQLSNIGHQIFKSDDSKLLQLTENMIKNNIVKTTLDFAKKFMFTFDSKDQFPINIDTLIEMKVYDNKGNCKSKLIKNFILDTDYQLKIFASVLTEAKIFNCKRGGQNKETIMLTVDCFKSMCMLVNSEIGKQVKIYYLDLEKIFKQYIILELKEKELQLTKTEKEKNKYLSLYNQQTQKHHYHRFKRTGSCFYIIRQGIEYADGLTRIKIGICGASRRKISECPHCEGPLEDDKNSMSFDNRLSEHRVLWPMLKIEFAVYTTDCDLLERNMKRFYRKQINPNGHEIIENVSVSDVIKQTLNFLNLFNFYSDKENPDYTLEEDIDKYNENTLTHMKKHIIQIEEIKDKIEEKEHEVKLINNFIKEKEDEVKIKKEEIKEKEDDIEEYKKHLNKKIGEFRDTELATILQNFGLSKNGLKQNKYDRLKEFVEKKIKELDKIKEIKIKQEEDNEDKRIGRRPNNYQEFVDSLLSKKLSKHQLKHIESKKGFKYCNGFCQDYCVESEFKKNNSYYMTICNTCAKMVNFADILIKNRKYTIHEIIKDISKIRLGRDQQVCVECFIVKKQYCFEGDRNQCKDCRYKSNIGKVKNFDVSKAVTEIKTNIKNIDKYTKLEIHKIAGHLNIKRKDTDVKKDMIDKIKKHII